MTYKAKKFKTIWEAIDYGPGGYTDCKKTGYLFLVIPCSRPHGKKSQTTVKLYYKPGHPRTRWTWDPDTETIHPSIHAGTAFHGWLKNGELK